MSPQELKVPQRLAGLGLVAYMPYAAGSSPPVPSGNLAGFLSAVSKSPKPLATRDPLEDVPQKSRHKRQAPEDKTRLPEDVDKEITAAVSRLSKKKTWKSFQDLYSAACSEVAETMFAAEVLPVHRNVASGKPKNRTMASSRQHKQAVLASRREALAATPEGRDLLRDKDAFPPHVVIQTKHRPIPQPINAESLRENQCINAHRPYSEWTGRRMDDDEFRVYLELATYADEILKALGYQAHKSPQERHVELHLAHFAKTLPQPDKALADLATAAYEAKQREEWQRNKRNADRRVKAMAKRIEKAKAKQAALDLAASQAASN